MLSVMCFLGVALADDLNAEDWIVVNDSVMGGVSSSEVLAGSDDGIEFRGNLSLENNGGFTSTRQRISDPDWTQYDGVMVELEGDGREYVLTVRPNGRQLRRLYYRAPFQTVKNERMTITIPFSNFKAYAYGTPVPQAPPLVGQLGNLGTVGIMLADKNPGPFSLRLYEFEPARFDTTIMVDDFNVPYGDTKDVLLAAIATGVPLYNAGQPERCADIYQMAVLSALLLRGEDMPLENRKVLETAVLQARAAESESDRAWILRLAMDRVLEDQI